MNEPQKAKSFFPNIFRFITERWKLMLTCFISGVILFGIVLQGLLLARNLSEADRVQREKLKLIGELSYWEQIAKEYEGYRDAYFRIASLEFTLGKVDDAKKSLDKVLSLDPNFAEGVALRARIGL